MDDIEQKSALPFLRKQGLVDQAAPYQSQLQPDQLLIHSIPLTEPLPLPEFKDGIPNQEIEP